MRPSSCFDIEDRIAKARRSPEMNPYDIYRLAATAARVFLLAASLGGGGLLVVWFALPATIDAVDTALSERHIAPHRQRLQEAEAAEQRGEHAVAISHLEEARRALRPVLKGDRLDPLKRQALERLALAYRAAAREEAFAVLDEWSAFDPRDLRPIVLQASWRGPAGIDALLDLHARFPHAIPMDLEAQLCATLLDGRREVDALALAAAGLAEPPNRRWQVFWDDGSGIRAANSLLVTAAVDDAGALSFDVSVPGDAQRLRVDGPASFLLAKDLTIRLEGRGSPIMLSLADAKPRHQVRNVGDRTLEMAGQDPQIHVAVPMSIRGAEQLRAKVRGWVMTAPPPRLVDFLASSEAGIMMDTFEGRGDREGARRLRRLQQWLLDADSAPPPGEATGSPR